MAAKKKSAAKSGAKPPAKTRSAAGKPKKRRQDIVKQRVAVILFVVALFALCVAVIPGGDPPNAWSWLHEGFLGVFGLCAYLFPFLLGYVAVCLSRGGKKKTWVKRSVQCGAFLLLLSTTLDIFTEGDLPTYGAAIADAFHRGGALFSGGGVSGGVLGSLLGYPMLAAFGKIGAAIIACLALFVFVMLITGLTLMTLLRPVERTAERVRTRLQERSDGKEAQKAASIDVEMGEGYPEPSPKSESYLQFEAAAERLHEEEDQMAIDDLLNRSQDAVWDGSRPPRGTAGAGKERRRDEEEETDDSGEPPYVTPPLSLLKETPAPDDRLARDEMQKNASLLLQTLQEFGISAKVVDISRGPTVTRYELKPSAGVKISRITGLSDDIALRLATSGVRIEAPIPHKAAIGIEVPNQVTATVGLRELIDSDAFRSQTSPLTVALGRDIAGHIVTADLAKMPHLLIAGTTGSGKSVCTHSMIQSVLYRSSPQEVRMILIDPKQVEFAVYNGIPHLLVPVVTDPRKAAGALGWAVTEMLGRYRQFADNNVRDIAAYNRLAQNDEDLEPLPLILIVIDELSDLMMAAGKEVEDSIVRLAQMARAAGMHLVIATQRPSVDVITGLIKANIPSRLALTVASAIDSRTILDGAGADKLLGRGDMLFHPVGIPKPIRVQGCYVSDGEVEAVAKFLKASSGSEYDEQVQREIDRQAEATEKAESKSDDDLEGTDDMLPQAIDVVIEAGQASISLLQRKLSLGYARAGRIIDEMESLGIVGPHEGSKPRKVIMSRQQWLERQATRPLTKNRE